MTSNLFIYTSVVDRHTELVVLHLGTRGGFGFLQQNFINLRDIITHKDPFIQRYILDYNYSRPGLPLSPKRRGTNLIYHGEEFTSWLKVNCLGLNHTNGREIDKIMRKAQRKRM